MVKEVQVPESEVEYHRFMSDVVLHRIPDAKVYAKSSSLLMKVIYYVFLMWIWQRKFMTNYTTTIGYKVYVADWMVKREAWDVLYGVMRHEFTHMLQKEKHGVWFTWGYLFPQIFALLALGALSAIWVGPWGLMPLIFLLAALPFPAPFRSLWEAEGYTQTILVSYERRGSIDHSLVDRIKKHFTGPDYYFMNPFKSRVDKMFDKIIADIESKKIYGFFLSY